MGLTSQQRRGQFPRGRGREGTGHLLPNLLAAVPLKLPLELLSDRSLESVGRVEATELFQEGRRHLGKFKPLHIEDGQFHGHVLAADVLEGRLVGHLHGGGDGRARLGLGDELRESRKLGIGKREPVADDDLGLVGLRQHPVAVLEDELRDNQIAGGCGAVVRHESGAFAEVAAERLVDVGVGNLAGGTGDRQTLPLRHLELRPDLDRKLKGHRAIVGQKHRVDVEFGLADRRELLLLRHLRHGVGEQLRADLVGEFRLESAADEPPRGTARPKTRQQRRWYEVTERLIAIAVNVFAGDRHLHPPLAGRDGVDGNIKGERLGQALGGFGAGDGGCFGR